MPEIGLNAYLDEAKERIRANALDEAVAICRHILKQHPKYIEAYRVLAEASLEKAEHEEALDLFKRVLSADPENLISYIGLGIIYNEDNLSDEAIWQFERAFELSPGNAEIRRELKRLYAQRDGVEQPRLKLNRAALAHLYAKGGFYSQAISEFQSILGSDPERLDIQLALAETLWYDNRKREAAEVCQDILNKLPHCLKANLLLGEIWLRSGLEEDGNTLLRRAEGLDPENRRSQEMFGELSPLPSKTINIEKLSGADLAAATGITGKAPAKAERLDDWIQALKAPQMAEPSATDMTVILPETALREGRLEPRTTTTPTEALKPGVRGGLAEGEESPVIESLEKEFGALPDLAAAPANEEEQARIAASMPPESASAEEIMAWLRQQSAAPALSEEAVASEEEQPSPAKRPEEEESPIIAALEEEFGALPELTATPISEEEQAKITASMPPETASAEEIMAWLRQQTAAVTSAEDDAALQPVIEEPVSEESNEPETAASATEDLLAWLRQETTAVIPIAEEVAPLPIVEEPVVESLAPTAEEAAPLPMVEEPVIEALAPIAVEVAPLPMIEEPVIEAPAPIAVEVAPPPMIEEPVIEAPAPVAEEVAPLPMIEEPVIEALAPVAEEVAPLSMVEEPVVEALTPVAEEVAPLPLIEEPAIEAPTLTVEPAPEAAPIAPPTMIEHYQALLAANPADQDSRLALADALAQEAKWAEAAEHYSELARSIKPPDVLIGSLVTLTEAYPEQLALQQILGDAYMEAGRFDEAMAKYNWLLNKV